MQIGLEGIEILDRTLDAIADHHCPCLTADLALGDHLLVEMIHHDLGFKPDGVVVAFHIPPQLFLGLLGVKLRIVFHLRHQLVIAIDRRVGLEHIEDETLLHRLLHRVTVKGPMFHLALAVGRERFPEHLERLVLGSCGKSEVAGIGEHLARGHMPLDRLIHRVFGIGGCIVSRG